MGTQDRTKTNVETEGKPKKGPTRLSKFRSLWFAPIILLGAFIFASQATLWLIQATTHAAKQNQLVDNAESTAESIRLRLKGNQDYLLLLAKERGDGIMDVQSFQERASRYVADHPEMICINWVDADYFITDVAPLASNKQIVGLRLDLPEPKRASRLARETRQPVYTHPFVVIQGDLAFELWVPVYHDDVFLGLLGGIYSYEKLLHSLVGPQALKTNNVSVVDVTGKVLFELPPMGTVDEKLVHQVSLTSPENGGLLQFKGYGAGVLEQSLFLLVLLCLAFVIGIVYAIWRLKSEIEASKQAEEALRAASSYNRRLIEASLDPLVTIGSDGKITDVNKATEIVTGVSREQLIGDDFSNYFTEPEKAREGYQKVLAEGLVRDYPLTIRHTSGKTTDVLYNATVYINEKGEIQGIFAAAHDITVRKQTEQAMADNEKRFRALLESAQDGISLLGVDGKIVYASPATQRILGYAPEAVIGVDPKEYTHPDDLEPFLILLNDLLQKPGGSFTTQYRFRHKDGSWRWLESTVSNLLAESWVKAIVFNYRDVTERKQAEERIRRQLEHLTALRAIDRVIASNFDLELSLSEILTHVTMELGIDAADILILNSNSQMLDYGAEHGFRSKTVRKTQVRLGESYAGRAALERQLVQIPNLRDEPDNLLLTILLADEDFVCYYGVPLIAKGQVKGVLEVFHRAALEPNTEWFDFLNALAGQAAIAIENATLFESLQRSNSELTLAYDATIEGWSRALDLRDKETEGHTQRVTEMTVKLAHAFSLSEAELVQVRWGALLHDIGKMGVPDGILLKPNVLTDEEWVTMKKHPNFAYEMLVPIRYLRNALDIPYFHHEKWDGTGYPNELVGIHIPLAARIFAVVDVWDALTSDRPYRAAWPKEKAREHIRTSAGTHFDPQVVDVFMQMPSY